MISIQGDFLFMEKLDELLNMWAKDANIDRTEPGKALIDIPKLHSKWEYYTGKLDDDELQKRGWEPFPYVIKAELSTYMEADEDVNKFLASKLVHEEIVDVCQAILKELNNRAWELKSFIDWEKFIQGV
jgi:hypothetical protein